MTVTASQPSIEHTLFPSANRTAAFRLDLGRTELPSHRLRPKAEVGVLDITKWFGETSGGVRTYLLEKARYVEAHTELRQVLVIPGARDSITHSTGVRCYRLRGPRVPTQRPYRFMLATRSIRRIIHHESPSIIEVGSCFLVPWITAHAAKKSDVPLVFFYHSNLPRSICAFPERSSRTRQRAHALAWRYIRKLDSLFELTICASRFAASDLQSHGVDRVERVPLGVDLDHFNPFRRYQSEETRERLGLPLDAPVIAFIGRFAREKEVDVLIRAWPEIARRTDAHLLMVGDGPQRERLQGLAESHERVLWMPYEHDREQLANLLAAVDLFVAPGSIETFGLSALEALASGTPVLSADRGGVAEQIEASGAGSTFTAGDPGSLSETAIDLLGADLLSLGRRGRAYAEREHSWDGVFDRIFDIYRHVLAAA
ncbi:MAG TPA: glycosyltransferase [Gemmatimonadaceae bacterium]|nr:glycosyltransferase [Gemmatimonadaceae bacterium]